jgi:hypothetical protein
MNTSAPAPKRKIKNSLGENHYLDKVRKKEKGLQSREYISSMLYKLIDICICSSSFALLPKEYLQLSQLIKCPHV